MYAELDPVRIVETTLQLRQRITERFPGSGLSRVAAELCEVAHDAAHVGAWLASPIRYIRVLVVIGIVLLAAVVLVALQLRAIDFSNTGFSDTAQGVEAVINECVFVGIAVYFLLGIERRVKRKRALEQLRVLRSFAHIVDMHQLTKDPERLDNRGGDSTASSPKRELTPFLLTRYLDYSSELLAIISMIAAIYVQRFDDAETINAANGIEALTVGLSRKIWQKIAILDRDLKPLGEEAHYDG